MYKSTKKVQKHIQASQSPGQSLIFKADKLKLDPLFMGWPSLLSMFKGNKYINLNKNSS